MTKLARCLAITRSEQRPSGLDSFVMLIIMVWG